MSSSSENNKLGFALDKSNYILMGMGLIIIVIGFILMAGGRSNDPKVFNESMFNFQRVTLAPMLVFGGFVFEIYAILKKPKE
ncbi:MAG: DUF3098 domain-containing protein [Salinivirgaceae bacterium]|nr:DUF3098 domain-containing protein [Salinivirgaceae bacterium]